MYAIITGATHGIGAAIAKRLAQEHFSLAICSRNEDELVAFKIELQSLGSPDVIYKCVDLSLSEAIPEFANFVLQQFPQIDILVNNAGLFIPGTICDEPEGQLEMMLQLNVLSAYNLTRKIVPPMKQRQQGHIFNICSVASLKAYTNGGSYSISKYALLGFSDNLREELKTDNIKVTAICPGATQSRSWSGSGIADERIMKAEDIANILWSAYTLSQQTDVELIVLRPQLGDL
jgi:short-subunit dehydrogenase